MSVEALVPQVREALGVSSSYDDESIPALIRRCVRRLLRDYHFPKSIARQEYTNLILNSQEYTLPTGFKKDLLVQFYDPTDNAWSDPLKKSEGFRRPQPSELPAFYWLEGTKLHTDTPLSFAAVGITLQLFYESMDVVANETWLSEDFEDALFYYAVVRGAAEYRKPEVMGSFAQLWQDERAALAVYLNELEFNNLHMQMREPRAWPRERYPK